MGDKTSLGDRMKSYEEAVGKTLLRRTPAIVRVDGKAFHTFTRRLKEDIDPTVKYHFSHRFHKVMMGVANWLCHGMQGATLAYTQSDEISILLKDWETHDTQPWFDGKVQKITSISAGMASAYFQHSWQWEFGNDSPFTYIQELPVFDARVFNVPFADVDNYFIWRQRDAIRNSINYVGRKYFSQKQMHCLKTIQVKAMLFEKHGVQFDEYPIWEQRGACVDMMKAPYSSVPDAGLDNEIPVFSEDRKYITKHLEIITDDTDLRI